MSGRVSADLPDNLFVGLNDEQVVDAKRFLAFMDSWSQEAADATPDEWARAEQLATFLREHGHDTSAGFLVRVLRSCELFDALESATGQPDSDA